VSFEHYKECAFIKDKDTRNSLLEAAENKVATVKQIRDWRNTMLPAQLDVAGKPLQPSKSQLQAARNAFRRVANVDMDIVGRQTPKQRETLEHIVAKAAGKEIVATPIPATVATVPSNANVNPPVEKPDESWLSKLPDNKAAEIRKRGVALGQFVREARTRMAALSNVLEHFESDVFNLLRLKNVAIDCGETVGRLNTVAVGCNELRDFIAVTVDAANAHIMQAEKKIAPLQATGNVKDNRKRAAQAANEQTLLVCSPGRNSVTPKRAR
jgi:hypothetical protein